MSKSRSRDRDVQSVKDWERGEGAVRSKAGPRRAGARTRRSWWAWPLAVAAGMLPLAGLGVGSVAHASEHDAGFPTFTSSPRLGPAGTVMTAWGGGCSGANSEGGASLTPVGSQQPVTTAKIKPDAKGDWVLNLVVPSNASVGEYRVSAICTFERGTPNVYRDNSFTVRPTTVSRAERRLSVTPTSVPLGGSITVRGGACKAPATGIAAVTENGRELEGAQTDEPNANGDWTVRFTLKKGGVNPNSKFAVTAWCYEGPDQLRFTYDAKPFDVTAGSAPRAATGDTPPPPAANDGSPSEALVGTNVASPSSSAKSDGGGTILPWVLAGLGGVLLLGSVPVIRRFRPR